MAGVILCKAIIPQCVIEAWHDFERRSEMKKKPAPPMKEKMPMKKGKKKDPKGY